MKGRKTCVDCLVLLETIRKLRIDLEQVKYDRNIYYKRLKALEQASMQGRATWTG